MQSPKICILKVDLAVRNFVLKFKFAFPEKIFCLTVGSPIHIIKINFCPPSQISSLPIQGKIAEFLYILNITVSRKIKSIEDNNRCVIVNETHNFFFRKPPKIANFSLNRQRTNLKSFWDPQGVLFDFFLHNVPPPPRVDVIYG